MTVAYIYDRTSNRVRQTEASFAQSVDLEQIKMALNGMGGGQMPPDALDKLTQIYQRRLNRYSFTQGGLKGVMERNDRDRLYLAIWEADLHL